LEISYLDEINSTHLYLIDNIKKKKVLPPYAVSAHCQHSGIGSRGNSWQGMDGNLFLSFCIEQSSLPTDLPQQSLSIYFSYILKVTLKEFGSEVWLKWPNDFYIDGVKIGGTITTILFQDIIVCSIGLNLVKAPENFKTIDIKIDKNVVLQNYFLKLKENILWKDIFRQYKVEFLKSTRYSYYDKIAHKKISLAQALLLDDGSILLEGRRIYSLR